MEVIGEKVLSLFDFNTKTMAENKRLLSLDALRGFDMLFIMGFSGLVASICALWPNAVTDAIAASMGHVKWDGLAHHDTIFPLFLFIAGVSFPFSYANQVSKGMSTKAILWKVAKRCLILIALGLVYNGLFKLEFEKLRCASVLARIGIAWAISAVLYIFCNTKARGIIAAAILVGYSLLICLVVAPDAPEGATALSKDGNLVGYIDRLFLPGRILYGNFDPEGILSTVPAVVSAMLGTFTGEFLRRNDLSENKKALGMAIGAAALIITGIIWSFFMPINKMLWSSSFVCVVGGYSLGMLALFYYIIDVKGWKKWATFFTVIGLNSITIYMAQKIISFSRISDFFLKGFAGLFSEPVAEVINDFGYVAVCWLFLYFLYKKKVFLKI